MNRILIAVNVLLAAAVIFLFYKVYEQPSADVPKEDAKEEPKTEQVAAVAEKPVVQAGNAPTGKIAYVDIDRLNEESLEIIDLIAESKRRKNSIESSVESLSQQYQRKVEEFQMSQKAGIATETELRNKAREIENIEKEAQNKQVQMDNLSMDISDKNAQFQKHVKDVLVKWNEGRYDFILSYSEAVPSLLLGNSTMEVTNEVITLLNKEYKERKATKK
jgi:outer membrane protein